MQYCLAIPFFDKQNLFCMCQCKAFAQMVDIWKFAAFCLNRENFWSCVVHWSETAPCFLAVNSVGSWFSYFLRSGNQNTGYNTYMLQWTCQIIWIRFNLIFKNFIVFFKNLIVKMRNICNLIGWNSVHIFDILIATMQISMECETQES